MNYLKKLKGKYQTALKIKKEDGWKGIEQQLKSLLFEFRESRNYQKWIKLNQINDAKRAEIKREIQNFSHQPLISIILPVYNVEEKWLSICVDSVTNQLYEKWELCIADDKSPGAHIRKVLDEYSKKDKRIKVVFRDENGHISAASNSALKLAAGEFCVLLDHDDELTEDALFYVAKELNNFPETEMIYSDEDMIDENGKRYEPKFKPDFSRELFYSLNLITHLSAYKTQVLRKMGGFRIGAEGSQDYDLALRAIELIPEKNIRHIPRILYHWRAIRGSVALSGDEKPYAHERAREAIRLHLERIGRRAKVVRSIWNYHRVIYDLPENLPKIGLIFYSENELDSAKETIEKIRSETDYENLETIFIENADAEKLDSAVSKTTGEILCFVDANLKPLTRDWLKEVVSFAVQDEIGAVGARIIDSEKTVLQGGLIMGTNETVSAAHRGFLVDKLGNIGRNMLTGNFSAVSISCLCVKRNLFEEAGGFDFRNLPKRFFDADFCLKLREKGLRIVFTPYARMIRTDKQKRLNFEQNPTAGETEFFTKKWQKICENDPFYNPNLSKKDGSFSIEI
ncbi:MAG: glycosyltransferase [Pyrinomonadaceae bacterium]|nr:glycosyltransferase [Pyrinomonadaceae bacterium]